ncbi:MAG: ATP-binding protein, partial [Acidobacteriota bacterium]|nr:ATP-binding protein [Acidobacteriota bacterium]
LRQDFLINVTSFFRDPAVFEAVADRLLDLYKEENPPRSGPIRVWVPGCASGEEVYSLAICLLERAAGLAPPRPIFQLFATDLAESIVDKARAGIYPESIAQQVSAERLSRFFTRRTGHYQITKEVRGLCVFARHDVTHEPPFSHIDLISCRNLLLYFASELQEKVFATFHYALAPGGLLLVGALESASSVPALFELLDKEHRIYARCPTTTPSFHLGGRHPGVAGVAAGVERRGTRAPAGPPAGWTARSQPWLSAEIDQVLSHATAGVIVDEHLDILEFRGRTHLYLRHASGRANLSLMKMVRQELYLPLRRLLEEAGNESGPAPWQIAGIHLEDQELRHTVNLEVVPIKGSTDSKRYHLVLFGEAQTAGPELLEPSEQVPGSGQGATFLNGLADRHQGEIARLEQELTAMAHELRTTLEEHETIYEELQSANEELLSANEEFQSLNEEMETTREEVQAVNEELETLNLELNERNLELGRLNDDLLNVLGSISIPIVLVDSGLRVRRFTPAAERLFNLLPTDLGRPLAGIRANLVEPLDLEREIRHVIATAEVLEREVRDEEGTYYSLRIRPYLTHDSKIDGAVVLLFDVDALRRSAEEVARALGAVNAILRTLREPLLVLDSDLRVEVANQAYYDFFRTGPEETEGRRLHELGNGRWDLPALRSALGEVLFKDASFGELRVEHDLPEIGRRVMVLGARRLQYGDHAGVKVLLGIADRTEVENAVAEREALLADLERVARDRAWRADQVKHEFLATISHELRGPLQAMTGWIHVLRGRQDAQPFDKGLAAIDRGVRAQTRLIEDLLDHSRIVAGQLRLVLALIDLGPVTETALESVRAQAEAKELHLELRRPGGEEPLWIEADPDRLQQVISNLLSNAVKFTPRGGRIEVSIGRVEAHLELTVSDTGRGIRPDFLPHVFERFRQADSSPSLKQPGLGLGLAIVHDLVELHGGTVVARSRGEGQGAEFTVSLPIPPMLLEPPAVEPKEPLAAIPGAPGTTPLTGVRVLLVEDDANSREAFAMLLAQWGAEVQ